MIRQELSFFSLRNGFFHNIKSLDLLQIETPISAISRDENLIKLFNKGFKKITPDELYEIENKWIIHSDKQIYKKSYELSQEEKNFIKMHSFNVSISKAWEPFTFISKENKPAGISTDIWEMMANKLSLEYKYNISDNFTEQLNSIKSRENDIIFSVGETKDRKDYSIFTEPYLEFPVSIVTLKDENFIENIDNILDRKIAVGRNFTAHKLLKEKYPELKNLILVNNVQEGLKKSCE